MELSLLPRLKPTAAIRNELYEVIELYVECVAGRRMPRAQGFTGEERVPARSGRAGGKVAEKRPAYRSGAAVHA
jgi:hypothetical protein